MTLSPLWRYVMTVLALLPVTFMVWVYLDAWLSAPARMLARWALEALLPSVVASAQYQGDSLLVLTRYGEVGGELAPFTEAGNQVGVTVNVRLVSYGLPFYAALLFGLRGTSLGDLALGVLCLWPVMATGLTLTALKDLAATLGAEPVWGGVFWLQEATLLGYQFSVLLAPTLVPMLLVFARGQGTLEQLLGAAGRGS